MDADRLAADPGAPLLLEAGPFSATLVDGALSTIQLAGAEVLSGVYVAVRDRSWGTIAPAFTTYDVRRRAAGFDVRLAAACRRTVDDVDIEWTGAISGDSAGMAVEFDAVVRRPFLAARIGLCVLHPQDLAGTRLAVDTPWGTLRGRFPTLITASLPFSNIRSIRQGIGRRTEIEIQFEGDLFQMEDQRAFSDPTFKTFSTPLELPWPVLVQPGTHIHQAIRIRATRADTADENCVARRSSTRDPAVAEVGVAGPPRPRIGTGVPSADVWLSPEVLDAIEALGLDYVRAVVTARNHGPDLERAVGLARRLDLPLALGIVAAAGSGEIARVVSEASSLPVRLDRIAIFDPVRHTTPPVALAEVRGALAGDTRNVPTGGGSRGYFYQLALDGLPSTADFVEYPVNPQVHATDDVSILDTVMSLPVTVATARALATGAPVHVAPATLRPTFDPDLVGPEPDPGPGRLPARYDVRQAGILTASWTLGILAAAAGAGSASVVLHEAAGWGGLVAAHHVGLPPLPGSVDRPLPVGRVVTATTEYTDARVCPTRTPAWLSLLGLRHAGGLRLLLASRQRTARQVVVVIPFAPGTIAAASLSDSAPGDWVPIAAEPVGRRRISLEIRARCVVRVDVE